MTTPGTISLLVAAVGILVAALALRVSRAPGWRELRWFAVIAFTLAAYSLANLNATVKCPAPVVLAIARAQLALGLLLLWAWARYATAFAHVAPSRAGRAIEWVVVACAALALLPRVSVSDQLIQHTFTGWNVTYTDARVTPFGYLTLLLCVPAASLVVARFADARRRGVRSAGVHLTAFLSVVALSLNDTLVSSGRFDLPYLLDLGFVLPLGLVGWAVSLRFVDAAQDLVSLRARLESLVEERTRALADTQEALVRAERLAALGQLANGVAHQVSSPASVVTANLRYLADALGPRDRPPDGEAREVVEEGLAAMRRINQLVRRLADAGRVATAPRAAAPVEVSCVVERALADARARLPERIALCAEVPRGLHVRARVEALEQVLQSLLSNAADAVPLGRAGRIEVRAEQRAGGIRISVADDGVGMSKEVLERAFEPFFTTKPVEAGTGLGLPVSRGIVEVHGGTLWLESVPGQGTTAVLILPESQPS